MSSLEHQATPRQATLSVTNIGGIDSTEVTFKRGTTVLSGRNATNRTSLLQGIMAALGSDQVTLKADAEAGEAKLEFGEGNYLRTLSRRNGTVISDGEPYLDDPELADLFAFLLESNEARQAVTRGEELRELIMRPVDTNAITSEIEQYEQRKRSIDKELSTLDNIENRLPKLESDRTQVTDEIAALRDDLEAAQTKLEETNVDVEQRREEQSELESRLDELRSTRSNLERTRTQIETERESIDALESEREEVKERLKSLSPDDATDRSRLEREIDVLQAKKNDLDEEISQLQSTIQFNEDLLRESTTLFDGDSDEELTDKLLSDDDKSITCWTCGSSVASEQIETTIEKLQMARTERLEERSSVTAELDEKRSTLKNVEENRRAYRQANQRLDSIDDEIKRRRNRIDELTDERESLTEEIDELEGTIAELESEDYSDVLEQHKEVNEIEFKLERKERELDKIKDEIVEIESRLDDRSRLEQEREEISESLTELRTRIDRIEANAVEAFNEHMQSLLEMLAYENIDRIWIDRNRREVREGRRKVSRSTFSLKIVRSTADGAAYEDSIDHLSESEREVTGLVFGLAGYLVHNVYETVPFMLLDSVEAIDSERIATLVEYFQEYVPYLVVALLKEDAQAIEGDHEVISEI